jgi:hypothetical protein
MATEPAAFKSLTYFTVGLENGRALQLKPGDYIPASFASLNPHQTAQWLSSGNVSLVTDPDPVDLEKAERAADEA